MENILKFTKYFAGTTGLDREAKEYFINVVLSNLIIFGRYEVEEKN